MMNSRKTSFDDSSSEDEDERRQRNKERNKEHARRTRLRKKEVLESLKSKVSQLEEENRQLNQSIQECSVASILLGLATPSPIDRPTPGSIPLLSSSKSVPSLTKSPSQSNFGACLAGGKRKRFLSLDGEDSTPPPMELNIKGHVILVGGPGNEGKSINWKTGVYLNQLGNPQQLTKTELEALRRERNRMHAKMTRDRKKCFIASLKRVIAKLEEENEELRSQLEKTPSIQMYSSPGDSSPQPRKICTSSSPAIDTKPPPSSMNNQPFYTIG